MIIPARFNGPPHSANGGYACGMLATRGADFAEPSPHVVEVTLHAPPPLDMELDVVTEGDHVTLRRDGALVATARSAQTAADIEVVPRASYDEATEVAHNYPGFVEHPFPTCYTCGPARTDGLRLFPGRLPDGRTAAPFLVPDDISTATVWAALDCPGGWSIGPAGPRGLGHRPAASQAASGISEQRPYVLGRMSARVEETPKPGNRCVVTGVQRGEDGRKAHVATTLWGEDGAPLATACATWIALP